MVSRVIGLALRGLQFLWTLLILAIVGAMIHAAFSGNPSIINFDMFVAIFSMLTLIYLIPATFKPDIAHPLALIVLDWLNVLFFFAAAIAMAVRLGVHSCGNTDYTHGNSITNGANNTSARCHEAQAVTAFLWFGFLAYLVSAVFSIFEGRSTGVNLRGGIRRGGPSMSQV